MARFAIVAPPLPGHLDPLQALAEELARRGHRCIFVHQADGARWVRSPDAGHHAVGASTHPPGELDRSLRRMARLAGPIGMRALIRDLARTTDMLCRELPRALEALAVDAVIADQAEAAGGLVARGLGLPFVSTATALPLNREPGVPPPFVRWPYLPGERGERRNAGGWRVSDWLMRPVAAVVSGHARRFGLDPATRPDDCFSPLAQVAQAVAGLDFPRAALPAGFVYAGPFRGADEPHAPPELPDDGRPLAFCSLGTLQGSRAGLFARVARACAELDVRLVIAHGGLLDARAAAALPARTIVRDFVPQRALLARCAVAITHCGFNTVLDALAQGVPLVAMPLAFEQPATAARIERAGAGIVVSARWASRRTLREAIRQAIEADRLKTCARALAGQIAAAGGVSAAADAIEGALGIGKARRTSAPASA